MQNATYQRRRKSQGTGDGAGFEPGLQRRPDEICFPFGDLTGLFARVTSGIGRVFGHRPIASLNLRTHRRTQSPQLSVVQVLEGA